MPGKGLRLQVHITAQCTFAKEKLWECGRALWGSGERTDEWAHLRCDDLRHGRFDAVLEQLRPHAAESEACRLGLGYFEGNRARMRYDEFRAQGLCVGSGVVEAGCKTVVGERCKQSGMRWTVSGVNAILALRSCVISGRYEDYWERRAAAADILTCAAAARVPEGREASS